MFKDKAAWKASKDNLKQMLNAGVKNPITKLFKAVGRIVTVGLEQIRPYDKKDIADIAKDGTKTYRKGVFSKIKDLFRHPKFGMKQMAGYPMRIILGMMIILPFLSKIAVKGSHLVFGKPKKSVLDEGKEPEQNAQLNQQTQIPPQLQQQQVQQPQNISKPTQANNAPVNNSPTNLLNQYKNGTAQSSSQAQTNINNNQNPQEPVRTYIPSPVGVQLQPGNEDLTSADVALKRADSAEQLALQTLKMN